jgi:hypothetical protein
VLIEADNLLTKVFQIPGATRYQGRLEKPLVVISIPPSRTIEDSFAECCTVSYRTVLHHHKPAIILQNRAAAIAQNNFIHQETFGILLASSKRMR